VGLFSQKHEGEIPIGKFNDLAPDAIELARLWVNSERVNAYVAYKPEWPPELFGSLLVETIYTAAGAIAQFTGLSEEEARTRIWQGFDEERERLKDVD
jgi:hypothetical protein